VSWHAGWCGAVWTRLPCALQSVCERHTHTLPPRRASVTTSRRPSLLVGYLEAYLGRLERWLTALLFVKAAGCIKNPRAVQFLGQAIEWVETVRYLGVILDTQLTWSAHFNHLGKKAAQRLGVLGPFLNRRSGLSVRNGVLLSAAHPSYDGLRMSELEVRCTQKLQVLQSKCLRITTNAPWYGSNRQIHEDLGIPFFADHIRAMTESFDTKLADAGNPLVRQLGRHLCRPRAD
jgi:hypothetical protein